MLLNELTSEQLSEWQAYNQFEPIGDWSDNFRFARLSALISNIVKAIWGKKGSYQWSSPKEFMPDYREEPKQQSVEDMKSIIKSIAKNAKKVKKNG